MLCGIFERGTLDCTPGTDLIAPNVGPLDPHLALMTRLLVLLATLVLTASAATAQTGVYNTLDGPESEEPHRGVRIGLGIGPTVYAGPDLLVGESLFQSDVVATNLGVTAEVTVPLAGRLHGRLLAGLLNIGADDDRPDLTSPADNPFLTSETFLAEGDLLFYLARPRRTGLAPYVFTGLSGLFATGDAADGVSRSALALPLGAGLELGLSRNLSLFAETSYRFGLTSVGEDVGTPLITATALADDCVPGADECEELKALRCADGPTLGGCPRLRSDGDSDFDTRFNSALVLAGLRLGFGRGPAAAIPPPPPPPPSAVAEPEPEAQPEPPATMVCDLTELNPIYFDYGSTTLDRRALGRLEENVELLLANPGCCVLIDGYTDSPEGDRFGLSLAQRRALTVYDYYLGRGVNASRLQTRSRGTAMPNCDKEDPGLGCERNRRVESLPVDCERFQLLLDTPSSDAN